MATLTLKHLFLAPVFFSDKEEDTPQKLNLEHKNKKCRRGCKALTK